MKNLIKMVILWAGTFTAGGVSAAVQIQTFSPSTNDRFANDPAFQAGTHDWSGVGRSAANGSWVTMLSSNVFLGAKHFNPGIGGTVTFFTDNDPSGTPVTATVATAQQIGTTDLWIGVFAAPLPSSIATYSYASEAIPPLTYSASPPAAEFYMSGVSPTSSSYGAAAVTNQAVGTNRFEGFLPGLSVGTETGDALLLVDNRPGDLGYSVTPYETALNLGDSGSPLMYPEGGALTVAGIAWAEGTTTVNVNTQRDASVYSYTGSSAAVIQAYINAHAVPEPSAAALSLGLLTLAFRRRRRVSA